MATKHSKVKKSFSALLTLLSFFSALLVATGCTKNETTEENPPFASFTYTSSRVFPVQVQFVNLSTNDPGNASYLWDFGDGTSITTNAAVTPLHLYVAGGVYLVKLVQTLQSGIKDSVIISLNISIAGPSGNSARSNSAAFSLAIVASSYRAQFTNTSTLSTSYLWEFGDGTTSTNSNPSFTKDYPAPGTYHVRLTATGEGGVDTCGATITF